MEKIRSFTSKTSGRDNYHVCKSEPEVQMVMSELKKNAKSGEFFRDIITQKGLVVYEIRDYKNLQYGKLGCPHCARVYEAEKIFSDRERQDDKHLYLRRIFICPTCEEIIGWQWVNEEGK